MLARQNIPSTPSSKKSIILSIIMLCYLWKHKKCVPFAMISLLQQHKTALNGINSWSIDLTLRWLMPMVAQVFAWKIVPVSTKEVTKALHYWQVMPNMLLYHDVIIQHIPLANQWLTWILLNTCNTVTYIFIVWQRLTFLPVTSRPEQNGRPFDDDILKFMYWNETAYFGLCFTQVCFQGSDSR